MTVKSTIVPAKVELPIPLWFVGTVEHDVIPDTHCSAAHHVGIERKPAAESADDIFKHLRIALEGVWIDRRHHAAAAQGIELHKRVSDVQLRALPERFGLRLDSSNEDVRSKASDVPPEHRHSSIGRDEQRADVEPLETFVRFEPRVVAGGVLDECQGFRAVPRMTVDAGRASEPSVPNSPSSRW